MQGLFLSYDDAEHITDAMVRERSRAPRTRRRLGVAYQCDRCTRADANLVVIGLGDTCSCPTFGHTLPCGPNSLSNFCFDLVTSGMYVSPITVYREYVQNAADALDQARASGLLAGSQTGDVSISIDHAKRLVRIRDNGCGIREADVLPVLLAIGGSSKRGTSARGFRGVGRLSGLAYCRELMFRTRAAGDPFVTTVTWDCRALRAKVGSADNVADFREILAGCVSVSHSRAECEVDDDHFFEVNLKEVARHRQDVLLNERAIAHYLGQVASVSFSPDFVFGEAITAELQRHLPGLRPIRLTVSGHEVFRPHRNELAQPGTNRTISIRDVEFFNLINVDGEIGAVGWLGHHDYVSTIPTSLGVRGLRARVGDIQIGEANLFDEIYKEARFNGWTIGEVNITDRRILPNARRDNFEVNHHSYNLLIQLGPIAGLVSQRSRSTSVSRNAALITANTLDSLDALLGQGSVEAAEISRGIAAVQRCRAKLKVITSGEVRAALEGRLSEMDARLEARRSTAAIGLVAADEAVALVGRIVTNRAQAEKLITALRNLQA